MNEKTAPAIRSSVTDDEFGGFRITIPPLLRWPGWGAGFLVAAAMVALGLSLLCWLLLAYAVPAMFVTGYFLLDTLTRRIVMIDGKTLAIRSELAGFTRTKSFELAKIRNLRPIVHTQRPRSYENQPAMGCVAFDYDGRCHGFGKGLSEEEILRMVKTIRDRFPTKDYVDDVEPLPVGR